jgi:hypothetical protein
MEGLDKLKKIHLIGTRARDLPACIIVPQPTTLLSAKFNTITKCQIFKYTILIIPKVVVQQAMMIKCKAVFDIMWAFHQDV